MKKPMKLGWRPFPCGTPRLEDEPEGYGAWFDWAEKKAKTHHQTRWPKCGLYHVWEPNADPLAWMDGSDWADSNPFDKEADNAPTSTDATQDV